MITKLALRNYRTFRTFEFECNESLNIIVGDNEAGKSTILEALNLVLTKRLNGRPLELELSPYLFNRAVVEEYVEAIRCDKNPDLPAIIIEVCLKDDEAVQSLRGTNNLDGADCVGIGLRIEFDEDFRGEYQELLKRKRAEFQTVPVEYYKTSWYSFAYGSLTARGVPLKPSYVDASHLRLQSGTDFYLQSIVANNLDAKEKAGLAVAYRSLKEEFSRHSVLKEINGKLGDKKGEITDRNLAVTIDFSQRGGWESSLAPHIDDIPYSHIGKGEQQKLKIMLALDRKADDTHVVLVEEPENHLSFSSMSMLLDKIVTKCVGRQVFITTHSAYVLNKLGLGNVILLHDSRTTFLSSLKTDTQNYFKKLSGYDTLRLILSKRSILVEGPSDDLILQRAFRDKHGKLPLNAGVDVLTVHGLSFPRFLDIAAALTLKVRVVTDNDGDYANTVTKRYSPYKTHGSIEIFADANDDLVTLEDHVVALNDLALLNEVLGRSDSDKPALLHYMKANKTEWALRVFDSAKKITIPQYVLDAIQ